jgi:hypothetical protein
MRLSNPLLLASLGIVLAAASCTLITDVDRSKIPEGSAGVPGGNNGGDGNMTPEGGMPGNTNGGTTSNGGQPEGGLPSVTPQGGTGAEGGTSEMGGNGGVPGTPDAGAGGMVPNAGAGGAG